MLDGGGLRGGADGEHEPVPRMPRTDEISYLLQREELGHEEIHGVPILARTVAVPGVGVSAVEDAGPCFLQREDGVHEADAGRRVGDDTGTAVGRVDLQKNQRRVA